MHLSSFVFPKAHPASYSVSTTGSFPRRKAAGGTEALTSVCWG